MTQHVREPPFLQRPPPAAPLLPWSTPDCRSARRGSSPAYPAKIMRLIVSRLQSANSTASYRNRGAAVQLYPHANSLDSISRNGGYLDTISSHRRKFSAHISSVKLDSDDDNS